jgi:hypothetical protein
MGPFGLQSRAQKPCRLLRNDRFMPIVAGARRACRSTLPSLEGALSVTATVPLPQRTTKRPGWRPAGVAVAYKLLEAVQARRRRLNGPGFGALVRAGTEFIDGKLQERDDYERKFGGAPPAKAVNRQVRWLGGIQWLHQRQATTAMTT